MAKDEYLQSLTAKMQTWRVSIDQEENSELQAKYQRVVSLLTMYERMGACAWREEERELNQACAQLEAALSQH